MPQYSDLHYLAWTPVDRFFDGPADFHAKTGIGCRQYDRWKSKNRVHWHAADAIAVALGTHPELIWGDEWQIQTEALIQWTKNWRARKRDANRKQRLKLAAMESSRTTTARTVERSDP